MPNTIIIHKIYIHICEEIISTVRIPSTSNEIDPRFYTSSGKGGGGDKILTVIFF